ncbi:hypothetical protein FLAG1_00473 [Fusarium langsethiae]|uniref:Uncharacterized protein n=1 Tax=Fusarium langsethiae TaxID=179993 RepID=A0A0M9F5Y1_FUSLA|nr:hypothetical protein FLAG1_00473 [Fusarium langsethiae]
MAHRRTTSASHVQVGCDADVDTRRYASSTSGVTYTRGSVLPDGVSIADSDEFEEESFCDLSDYELEGPSPHGTYYTTANHRYGSSQPRPIASNKGGCHTHADGSARRGFQPGNDLSRISTYQHQRNSYSGNFSQPGRYATSYQNCRTYSASHGGRNLRQTYPSDHYDEAGNYTGPPAVDANPGDLVSFPRLPDSDPPSLEDEHENTGSQRHISISETSKRSFSEQLVSGVRSLWTSESNKDQVAPQPPRTGTYLFCRHYLIEECACITALEDDGVGDYCQKCWEGRCDGPRPPHSVVRRSLW